jgi:hypothetical protein
MGSLASCKKDFTDTTSLTQVDPSDKAFVKVISATTGATRNFVYLPTPTSFVPLSGSLLSYGGTLPTGNSYFQVQEGQNSIFIRDTLSTSTQVPIFTVGNFDRGKYYTLFTFDTATSIRTKLVADNLVVPTDTTARVRFANFVRSASAIPNFDIFSKNLNANVFTNVALNDVTSFVPYATNVADSIFVRATGTSTNLIGMSITPVIKRSYTILFRGRYDANGASPTVPRTLTTFINF